MPLTPLPPLMPFLGLLAFAALVSELPADTIYLQTGEKLNATVLSDNGTTVEAEVKVSNGISDVRLIDKSDILRIEKPDPASQAFDEIKAIQLPVNSLDAADYDKIISGKLQAYLTNYPLSKDAAQVQKLVGAFKSEKSRVQAGEVKVGGEWYSAEQAAKSRAQIAASLLFQQIQAAAVQGDFLGALNQFSILEKNHKGARIYPEAVLFIRGIIPLVVRDVNNKTLIFNRDMEERAKGMAITPDYRKQELIDAAQKEEAQSNAALDAAAKAGVLWTPIYPRNQRSLDDLKKTADAESVRLAAVKVDDMRASIKASDEGRALLKKGDLDGAADRFTEASKLWAENEEGKENAALLAEAKAVPTPTPTPEVAATPTPKPVVAATPRQVSTPVAPVPEPEPEKSFFLTLPGMLSVLVIVGVLGGAVAFLTRGRKKEIVSR